MRGAIWNRKCSTGYIQENQEHTLRTMDRVLFKTLNANVKLLHSNSPIEKERAILDCGEALYISEGNEICKVCFANAHNIGE